MYIYTGNCLADCTAPPLPVPRYPSVYHDGVQILRRNQQTRGLRIRLSTFPDLRTSESGISVRDVYFGDSAQDVISAVGAPARTFYKSEDKMKIHSPNAFRKAATHKSDYFYNYFTLGFVSALRVYFERKCCWNLLSILQDILFDARTNSVKKFVLHTNFPGHYNFNMWVKIDQLLCLQPKSHFLQQAKRKSFFLDWSRSANLVAKGESLAYK